MATPKYKTSKAKSRTRKAANMKLTAANLISCANCGAKIMSHRVCGTCGFYKGKQVIETENL